MDVLLFLLSKINLKLFFLQVLFSFQGGRNNSKEAFPYGNFFLLVHELNVSSRHSFFYACNLILQMHTFLFEIVFRFYYSV